MELICFHGIAARGLEAVENTKSYGGKVRLRLKDYTITKQGPKISCGGCYCCFGWGWGVVVAGFGFGLVAGAFVVFFFTGFFAGSVSSTTTFFGGCALAAWAFCSAVRSRLSSTSFSPDKFSMRSANERRERSRALRSFSKD